MDKQSELNLVWIDLEMTGLDPDLEVIIEIASLVTDPDLNVLAEGPCLAIHQSDETLARMDAWNQKHHNASGLVERVRKSKISNDEASRQTLEFIKQYCPKNTAPLCGNSITQDRKFLCKYMSELHEYLQYRSVDVTSIKELVRRWYPDGPKLPRKSDSHMALTDVRESLSELIFYREQYFTSDGLDNPKIIATQNKKS